MNNEIGIIGLGWLGSSLANSFVETGQRVWGTCTGLPSKRSLSDEIHCFEWRTGQDIEFLQEHLARTSCLIICLSPAHFSELEYQTTMATFIQAAPLETHFIYTSSIGIYPKEDIRCTEESEILKSSKLYQAESMFHALAKERTSIFRLGGLIGADRNPVVHLVKKENENPEGLVQLIHKNDCIEVLKKAAFERKKGIWNLVNPDEISRAVYYKEMARRLYLEEPIFISNGSKMGKRHVISSKIINDFQIRSFTSLYSLL